MRDDAVLRRALPLGRRLGRLISYTVTYCLLLGMNGCVLTLLSILDYCVGLLLRSLCLLLYWITAFCFLCVGLLVCSFVVDDIRRQFSAVR